MSRPTLNTVVRKGAAMPASLEPSKEETKEVSNQPSLEPVKEESKPATNQPSNQGRKRSWDGKDDYIKVNYEVPQRVQMKLHQLKAWDRIDSLKDFVAKALEQALDREIAKAEKEGY